MPALIPLAIAAGGAVYNHYANPDDKDGGSATSSILGAGLNAATSIYSAGKQADAARGVAQTQADALNRGADLQSQATANALAFQKQQAENDFRNAEATRAANYGQYLNRYHGAQSLGDLIGFHLQDAPAYQAQTDPQYGGGPSGSAGHVTAMSGSGSQEGAQFKAILDSGLAPQDAVAKFNQQYGRVRGNEAVLEPNGTIGLPSGYFSNGETGWRFAPRSGGSERAAPTMAAMVAPAFAPRAIDPASLTLQNPYQPPTINAYLGAR